MLENQLTRDRFKSKSGGNHITEQIDGPWNSTGASTKCNSLPSVINTIFGELGNGKNGSLLADTLAMYIKTRNQRVSTKILQVVTNKLDT